MIQKIVILIIHHLIYSLLLMIKLMIIKKNAFKVTIERDSDDKENLYITSISDRYDKELPKGVIELHIQSLGADENTG